MEYFEEPIRVYIKTNANNEIIEVGSSIFIEDLTGWIEIDRGYGDRYAHAQNHYFDKRLTDEYDRYNYKYINNTVVEV